MSVQDNEYMREYKKRRYSAGICAWCKLPRLADQKVCAEHLEHRRAYGRANPKKQYTEAKKRWNKEVNRPRKKLIVMSHYGGKCVCCGESQIAFLTLDHINNDGHKDPRVRGGTGKRTTGTNWYDRIIKLGFPSDMQVLCWNCNVAKHHCGRCPHQA